MTLSGTGQGPAVGPLPSSLSFGNEPVGQTSAPQSVSVTNTGQAPLNMTGISVGGTNPGDFHESDNCNVLPIVGATLQPGQSCTLNVTFQPTQAGARSATINITDNAPGSPQMITLSGTGTSPQPPQITSVSQVIAETDPPVTISGSGFGTFSFGIPYTGTLKYFEITDNTKGWNAGYGLDGCTVTINQWSDTSISLVANVGGFFCPLSSGDSLTFSVWNPQTMAGPATYNVTAQ